MRQLYPRRQFRSESKILNLKTGLRGWNDYEQPLQNSEGTTLTLDEADEYFLPRVTPEQLGAGTRTESIAEP